MIYIKKINHYFWLNLLLFCVYFSCLYAYADQIDPRTSQTYNNFYMYISQHINMWNCASQDCKITKYIQEILLFLVYRVGLEH